jgi:hypothetical protein
MGLGLCKVGAEPLGKEAFSNRKFTTYVLCQIAKLFWKVAYQETISIATQRD